MYDNCFIIYISTWSTHVCFAPPSGHRIEAYNPGVKALSASASSSPLGVGPILLFHSILYYFF